MADKRFIDFRVDSTPGSGSYLVGHDSAGTEFRIAVANLLGSIEVPEAQSIYVQYSANGSSWVSAWTSGCKFMRIKIGAGAWSNAMAIADVVNVATMVKVGNTYVGSGSDYVELEAGSNVTLTPDAEHNKVTIAATGGGGGGSSVQSDWEQDDDTADDFIKNKPTIPDAQIQSDWNQSDNTKKDFIKNKPTIPAAQIQSDWSQSDNTKKDFIKNKPTIPTVNNSAITFTQGGVTKGSFTLNQSSAQTIALDAGGGSKLVQVDMIAYDVNSGYRYSGIMLTDGLVVFNIYDSLLYEYDQTNTQWQVSATELNDGDLIYSRLEDACYIFNADDSKLKAVSSGKSLMELVSHDSLNWFKVNLPECNSRSVFEITSANSLVSAYDVEIYTLANDWETELGSAIGSFHNIILKNTKSTDVTFTVVDNSWQDGGNSCEGVISSGLDSNNSFTVKANDFVEISIYISDFTVDGYTGVPIIIVKDGYQSNVTETPI